MVNAGRILIMPKGDWNALTTYDMLDLVAENGIAYLARQTNIGQNPSTDTSMTYWQPFGSASAIATTSAPGLVMPDGETISIDGTGLINVNIDNNTLVYDSVNHYLKAVVSSALANLTDVNITSAQNGQALIYDSTSQKWENTTLYGDGIALSNVDGTTVTGAISALQAPTFTEAGSRTNVASGDAYTTLWGKVKKWFSDINTDWGADIGEIKAFMRTTAPTGYLACDGTSYSIGDYPLLEALFTSEFGSVNYFGGDGATTWKVPDLRGEFLRGTGTNGHSGEGNGANVGEHQTGTIHVNVFYRTDSIGVFPLNSETSSNLINSYTDAAVQGQVTRNYPITISSTGETTNARSFKSRPTNTSVLYCIRAYH